MRLQLKRLWHHISQRQKIQLGILLVVMLFASLAEVASIGLVLPFLGALIAPERVFLSSILQPIISSLGLSSPSQLIFPLTLLFILAALFSGAMRLILLYAQTRLGFSIGADFSAQIYKNTLHQPYSVHLIVNSSEVIAGILTKTNTVINSTLLPVLILFSSSLILLAIMTTLIVVDAFVSFVAFGGFGFLYILIMWATKKRLINDGRRINSKSNQLIKALQEGLGGIRDVLIDGSQATYCRIYRDADVPLRKSQANVLIIGGAPRFVIEAFGMVIIAVIAYLLAKEGDGISSAIPVLGTLTLAAQRLLPVLQQLYSSWTNLRSSQASLEDVLNLLDQPLPEYTKQLKHLPIQFQHEISLEKANFCYENGPLVLKDINIKIRKGSCVGFMGKTGSGKSTLLDILMGLLEPTSGHLKIDGVPISTINHRSWQAHIAHVPQAIFLADTTIAENIAFGVSPDKIDYERVRGAASKAQISSLIESLEKKYETYVGERGVRLSGGQRQRIGIARALYKEADVIIFDEATSALDNDTENNVMDGIDSLGEEITVILVAHRLTTLKKCTQIIELEQGKIIRTGSYENMVNVGAL